jgi:hypothetical protein
MFVLPAAPAQPGSNYTLHHTAEDGVARFVTPDRWEGWKKRLETFC